MANESGRGGGMVAAAAHMVARDPVTADIEEGFRVFDLNGDGFITVEELERVMSLVGQNLKKRELMETFRQVDGDGNGIIDFLEFKNVVMQESSKITSSGQFEEEIRKAFDAFDKDQNGFISRDELFDILNSLGAKPSREDVLDMMKQADIDGDGALSYAEFLQVMAIGT